MKMFANAVGGRYDLRREAERPQKRLENSSRFEKVKPADWNPANHDEPFKSIQSSILGPSFIGGGSKLSRVLD